MCLSHPWKRSERPGRVSDEALPVLTRSSPNLAGKEVEEIMWIKKLVAGSPLEAPARRVYNLFKADAVDTPDANTLYDRQTVAVMDRSLSKNSNCVDVGCHTGQILKQILRYAPTGTHYAFEPLPELYRKLTESFPGVNIHNLALSDAVGETSFQHVTSFTAYSGFRMRKYDRPDETIEEIKVKTDLLDNIIPQSLPLHFIKIDVEGAELQVLRGAVNTIRRSRPVVVFEHGLGAADFYGTTPEEVYDLLTTQCGLRVSLMQRWLEGSEALSREEFADQFHKAINYYFMAYP